MPFFRKKPVVIEAQRFDGSNASAGAILYWIGRSEAALVAAESGRRLAYVDSAGTLFIRTLESGDGYHVAAPGDWIVKGVKGEFYPCKPDIFDATNESEADRPRIVCLCGSTRFPDAWKRAHRDESLAGRIVLSVGVMIHAGDTPIREDSPEKAALDRLHLRKIDLADEVLVLNLGGYIGASTRREIEHATRTGKPLRYLEPVGPDGSQ